MPDCDHTSIWLASPKLQIKGMLRQASTRFSALVLPNYWPDTMRSTKCRERM